MNRLPLHEAVEPVLQALREALAPGGRQVVAAFSGGLDSSVLLHGLWRLQDELAITRLRALHVHHGLMADAGRWAQHCSTVARQLGLPFTCVQVDARPGAGEAPEAAARRARYRAFREMLADGELLCVAQHADDQAETFLIQLLRGAGPKGLAAMPRRRRLGVGQLLRPFLELRRPQLEACALAWSLQWMEDPSNRDPRLLRSRIRHELLPLMRDIRPGCEEVMRANARLQAEAAESLAALAVQDHALCPGSRSGTLGRGALARLSTARRRELLRWWLSRQSLRSPGRRQLLELERQLLDARVDRCLRVAWSGGEVRTHADDVYAFASSPGLPVSGCWGWAPPAALRLPNGELRATAVHGEGLRAAASVEVRTGQAGVHCRPAGRAHRAPLREWLRRFRIPPWERPGLPLLFIDGELAAVADLFLCHGFQAAPGQPGLRIAWAPRQQQV